MVSFGRSEEQMSVDSHDRTKARKTSDELFYGSVSTFVAGLLLVMSYLSPYWLKSYEATSSPFQHMGLWEMCFYRFRHPDYQFDHLFHGCHPIYGDEYRLIREKLLPGWLIVVQLLVTLALVMSLVCQGFLVSLLLRWPLDVVLRFEHHFCLTTTVLNIATSMILALALVVFHGFCWSRDWLLYPNWNILSWSFALAALSVVVHIIAALFMAKDWKMAKERKEKNRALVMQMQPTEGFNAFAMGNAAHFHQAGGSGYI